MVITNHQWQWIATTAFSDFFFSFSAAVAAATAAAGSHGHIRFYHAQFAGKSDGSSTIALRCCHVVVVVILKPLAAAERYRA